MPSSREFLFVTAQDLVDPEQAANRINVILSHISDRLDRLEGLRDASIIRQPLRVEDSDGNKIHSFGS